MRAWIASCLIAFISLGYAGSDPVSWSLSPATGFELVPIGSSSSVTYTLKNNLPGSVIMYTQLNSSNGNFTIVDSCNNQSLAPNATCTVTLTSTPLQAEKASIQLIYGYHNNRIPLPTLSVETSSIPVGNIRGAFVNVPSSFNLSNPTEQPIVSVIYTNIGDASITGFAGDASNTHLITATPASVASVTILPGNTCGTSSNPITLSSGEFCEVRAQLTPLSIGAVNLVGLFTFNSGASTAQPTANTSVVNGSSACVATPSVRLRLPLNTYYNADNIVEFIFKNQCTSTSSTLGPVTLSTVFSPNTGQTTELLTGTDTCSNTVLPPQGSCKVAASVSASGNGSSQITVNANVLSEGIPIVAETTAAITNSAYQHTVHFINQCPFPVWYGVANDNTTNKADPTNPAAPVNYLLIPQISGLPPAVKTITFPGDYLGLFFGRTGCQNVGGQLFCKTAQCQPSAVPNGGKCILGNEPPPPYTKVEMNFFSAAQGDGSFDGVYDVSLIEGFNVPIEMKGLGPKATVIPFPPTANNSAFQCTTAGSPIQASNPPTPSAPLGSCSWEVTPPSTNNMAPQFFNFVTDGDTAAGQNNCNCNSENPVCGIAFKAANPEKGNLIMSCGQLLGTWSLKTLCTQPFASTVPATANNNSRVRFNCDSDISTISGTQPGYPVGTTLSSLYGCIFNTANPNYLNSCYGSGATTFCCGAADWNTTTPYITAQDEQSTTQNPDWGGPTVTGLSTIVPSPYESLVWYKEACPTAYSYPFDDHSSSFYCKQSSPGANVKMDYQVVFCPGGLTGQ